MQKPFLCPQTQIKLNSEPHGCQVCIKQINASLSYRGDNHTSVRLTFPISDPSNLFHAFIPNSSLLAQASILADGVIRTNTIYPDMIFLSERFNQDWSVCIFPQLTSGSVRLLLLTFHFPSLGSIWYKIANWFRMTTATIKYFISTTSSRIVAKLQVSLHTFDKTTRLKLAFGGNGILLKAVSLTKWISSSLNPKIPM